MTSLKKIGLEAVFLTAAFSKGLDVYTKGVKQAQSATTGAASAVNVAGGLIGGGLGTALQVGAVGFGVLANAALAATAAIAAGVTAAVTAITAFSAAMLTLGMRAKDVEGVEFAFNRMAGSVGLGLDQLRTAAAGTISDFELMKKSNLALSGSGEQLARRFGQDLPRILEMSRAGAMATGQSVEYIFNSLVTGIKRASPRLIDNIGLQIKLGAENEKLAASLGKTTDELTAEEKQIAVLNAVVASSSQFLDTFAGANETLGIKAARTKTSMQNIASVVGQFFVPALKTTFDAINRLLSAFGNAIQEGGALYNTMVKLGAVFQLVAEGFASGVDKLLQYLGDLESEMGGDISDWIDKAFEWGFNLIAQFAEGMISAANSVLQAAISVLSGSLFNWFAPGSPPKVAPMIDKWGAKTMAEYLKGFGDADFNVLKSLQSPLKSILDTLASSGAISKIASKEMFVNISKAMIGGLAGGNLESVYNQITQAAGTYGVELVRLIKLNLQLASAQAKAAKAQNDLVAARKKEEKLNTDLALQMMEYNDMARAGASPEVLAAKLAQVNVTEDSLLAAQGETKAAEEQKDAAEEQMAAIKEQVDLQKQLVDVLIDLAKAEDDVAQARKAAAAGAGAGAGGGLDEGFGMDWEGMGTSLQRRIESAITLAKLALKVKLQELWHELFLQIAPGLAELMKNWNLIVDEIERRKINWDAFWSDPLRNAAKAGWSVAVELGGLIVHTIQAALQTIGFIVVGSLQVVELLIENFFTSIAATTSTIWGNITNDLAEKWDWVKNYLAIQWIMFKENWDSFWNDASDKVKEVWENIKKWIVENLGISEEEINKFITAAIAPFKKGWEGISKAIETVIGWVEKLIGWLAKVVIPDSLLGHSPSPFETSLRGIGDALNDLSSFRLPAFQQSLAASSAITPAMAAQPISTTYHNSANVNMGGVSIYNGMGQGELEAAIRRVMRSEMAGV